MTLEQYLERKLWFYLEDVEGIENLEDKLDILLKVKQIRILEDISDELSYIRSEIEGIDRILTENL